MRQIGDLQQGKERHSRKTLLNKIQKLEEAIDAFDRLPNAQRQTLALQQPHGWKGWV
jgi:hypothetical protein